MVLVWVFVLGPFLVHQVLVRAVAQSEAASAVPRITFVDETARSGVRFQSDVSKTSEKYLIESMVGGVAMLDFNADGWLDLFFVNGAALADPMPEGARPDKSAARYWNRLYRNRGDGTFTDVSRQSGVEASPGKGLGVAVDDFDRDGWPDVFVANDSFPQQLFHNNGDGTFTETALVLGLAYDEDGKTFAGMGTDFGDYDNDGWPDIFVNALAHQRYALFRNDGGSFEYASGPTEVSRITLSQSGWGTKFVDFDNDGWKDLLVGQGHVIDNIELLKPSVRYLQPLLLMRNLGGRFEDVSKQAGAAFRVPLAARGVAFGDLNNDGRLDLAVNCNNGPALLLRNVSRTENHWLLVNTVGTSSNREGIGATLRMVSGSGREQRAVVSTASSYFSSNDKRAHFGLGRERTIRLLEISWPNGVVQRLQGVQPDQILTVRELRGARGEGVSTFAKEVDNLRCP